MRVSLEDAKKFGVSDDVIASVKKATKQKARPSKRFEGMSPIQAMLWNGVERRFEGAQSELKGVIPGRKFSLDIAFPQKRLAVEVDGWQHHGRFLKDFQRDRERQNLLTLAGWRILRFTAADIRGDIERCLNDIEQALS